MTEEQALIDHIQEHLDSGMWQHEACYLNRSDLNVIIKALKQASVLDTIRTEIEELEYLNIEDGSDGYDKYVEQYEVLNIIDKHRS